MDEEADYVAAVEVVGPLAAAFAMALNTTFQVLVTRNVISNGEAKALLDALADSLRQGLGVNPRQRVWTSWQYSRNLSCSA